MEGYRRNRHYLATLIKQIMPKIIFLQEIWLAFHDQSVLSEDFPEYNFQVSTPDMFDNSEDKIMSPGQVWHGAAIAWHNDLHPLVTPLPTTNVRFAAVLIGISDQSNILAISLYAPTSGKDDEFLECLGFLEEFISSNFPENGSVIIGTDSNCSKKSSSRRQLFWSQFCKTFSLDILASNFPTFHHNNGSSESSIDYFASINCNIGNLKQICTLETPLNLSSHDPLIASISVLKCEDHSSDKFSNTYTDFIRKKVTWEESKIPEYMETTDLALSEASEYWNVPEAIPHLCSLYSNLLVRSAEILMETKDSNKSQKATKSSNRIKAAEAQLQSAFRRWKRAGKPQSKLNHSKASYNSAKANLQRVRRYNDNLKFIKQNNDIMGALITDRNKIYSKMKQLRGQKSSTKPFKLRTPVGTFCGEDVLEGFAADAEHLGRVRGEPDIYDNEFYRLCKQDNAYIFDFKGNDEVKIAPMSLKNLDEIICKKMKHGKACDLYQLTVEHIRNCGTKAKQAILDLLNSILKHIYYLTCSQLKTGLGTAIHKGKGKPLDKAESFRRITVTPIIGSILDRYIDPQTENIFRPSQSPDQLGFTQGISYLLAAVQRGECQRWAIDQKMTCFGVSLDGEAAFPSVDRDIQVRELYSVGERGDFLEYSRNTYQNTDAKIKLDGKLSRTFKEFTGNRQGHVKASGHFKAYINPCLDAINRADLGFHIGPILVGTVCVADDTYVLSDRQSGLQSAMDIVSHYARRYRVIFNAGKTKIVVTGSRQDMEYYQDIGPWTLDHGKVSVVTDNEHLGLVVSGTDEEQKNVDRNIAQCRKSLFSLLGPALSYKCKLSPIAQLHLWNTYSLPVLTSGLSALPIRPAVMKSLTIFQNKILRGFLKLSNSSPIPSLYFLTGELPIEARIHLDLLTLFHNVISNPQTKIFQIVSYILKMAEDRSTTWSFHLKLLCRQYQLPDPLQLLQDTPMTKSAWKTLTTTRITAYHERELRLKAKRNSRMEYFNVQLIGLSGRPHPAIRYISETRETLKLRTHLKFLTGDAITFELLANQRDSDPRCRLCPAPVESTQHILTECRATANIRERLLPELYNLLAEVQPHSGLLSGHVPKRVLTQFLLDPTSLNLSNTHRMSIQHPRLGEVFCLARDWCFSVNNNRVQQLKNRKLS